MAQINSINSEEIKHEQPDAMPETYGITDRYLYKQNVERSVGTAVQQALSPKITLPPSNPNDYIYSRTTEFPQPSIAGVGVVTAAGAVDTSRFFFSQKWTVTKTATGTYRVTHNIGDNKYNVLVSPVATAAFTANISAYNVNDFQVKTWNAAGAAADCSFTFTLWIIP